MPLHHSSMSSGPDYSLQVVDVDTPYIKGKLCPFLSNPLLHTQKNGEVGVWDSARAVMRNTKTEDRGREQLVSHLKGHKMCTNRNKVTVTGLQIRYNNSKRSLKIGVTDPMW